MLSTTRPLEAPPVDTAHCEACHTETCPLRSELYHLRQQAGYWKTQFERAKKREEKLQTRCDRLLAHLKKYRHLLFGKKSEKKQRNDKFGSSPNATEKTRKRGQQPENPGPPRRNHDHLPCKEEEVDLPDHEKRCPDCGLPFKPFPGTEDSETIEIEVRAHCRRIRRRRYRPTCPCPGNPGIITAAVPPKLILKGRYGISVWVEVLLDKFLFFRPSHRLIEDLATYGIELPAGTLAGGLKQITPLLEPLYDAIGTYCRAGNRWHADETGWKVFVEVPEKPGHKRTLWVFCSPEAVFFAIALTRGAKEAEAFFGPDATGILNVDRYSGYKALTSVKAGTLLLAFCWAHTRRDFVDVARDWKKQESWAGQWLDRIGELFHINNLRVAVWRKDPRDEDFSRLDTLLREKLQEFREACDEELKQEKLHPARKKALTSVVNHWDGLTVFVDHPEVPMDNSKAERTIRGPSMGRKNYWGSGAVWAGDLAERCFSLFGTLLLAGLNVRTWTTAYLTACAENGGRVPTFHEQFLPWNLTPEQRKAFRQPLSGNDLPADVRGLLNSLQQSADPCGSTASPPAEAPAGSPPAEAPAGSPPAKEVIGLPLSEGPFGSPLPEQRFGLLVPEKPPGALQAEEPPGTPPAEEPPGSLPPAEPSDLPPAEKTTSVLPVGLLVLGSLLLGRLPRAESICLPPGHQTVASSCRPVTDAGRLVRAELEKGTVCRHRCHHAARVTVPAYSSIGLPPLDVKTFAIRFTRKVHTDACRGPPGCEKADSGEFDDGVHLAARGILSPSTGLR